MMATWWKGTSHQYYTIEKKSDQPRSFSEVVSRDPQDLGASSSDVTMLESPVETHNVRLNGLEEAIYGDCTPTLNSGGLSDMAMPTTKNTKNYSRTVAVGFHSQNSGGLD